MSAILNKLRRGSLGHDSRGRRSASSSSAVSEDGRRRNTSPDSRARTNTLSSGHSRRSTQSSYGDNGSSTAENGDQRTPTPSKQQTLTDAQAEPQSQPSRTPNRPAPLQVPDSGPRQQPVGTPKLMLTKEGSDSPRSVSDHSPVIGWQPGMHDVGLGLGKPTSGRSACEDDAETPSTVDSVPRSISSQTRSNATASSAALPANGVHGASGLVMSARYRAGSHASSSHASGGDRSRSGSMVSRVTSKIRPTSPNSLLPNNNGKPKKRRHRRRSNSTMSGKSGIVAALAKGGLQMAAPHGSDELSRHVSGSKRKHNTPSKRSPYLANRVAFENGEEGEEAYLDEEYGEGYDDEDYDSDLDEDLSVLGYAVASNRRNSDFHALFPTVEPEDYLIDDHGCALSKDILVQGRLYISENYLCFHANIFGWTTDVVIPFADVKGMEKKMTALVIPNAIGVTTATTRYTFASFISRDSVYDVMHNIWRLCNPNAGIPLSRQSSIGAQGHIGEDNAGCAMDPAAADTAVNTRPSQEHKPTQCACGKEGKHLPEVALEATFPSTPEKVYNLMFNSGWLKTFLSDSQNLKDVESSDWRPTSPSSSILCRSLSYVKPLNGSIGPKQTTCHITDSREHFQPDDHIVMVTTTRTPDVPSGGVFSVKTRTCFMWNGTNSTKVVVTTGVEWTGKSWIKGIIEKSAIDGQKTYHEDLKVSMLSHIQAHLSEFLPPGAKPDLDAIISTPPILSRHSTKALGADAGGSAQTPAQVYAERARKDRQEADLWTLQAGVDGLMIGGKAVGKGLKACLNAVSDIFLDYGLSHKGLMGILIVLLLGSNIYTYLSIPSPRSFEERRVARQRQGYDEQQLAEAVRMVLGNRARVDPMEEAKVLGKVLDEVQERIEKMREGIAGAAVESSQVGNDGALSEID